MFEEPSISLMSPCAHVTEKKQNYGSSKDSSGIKTTNHVYKWYSTTRYTLGPRLSVSDFLFLFFIIIIIFYLFIYFLFIYLFFVSLSHKIRLYSKAVRQNLEQET